MWGYIIFSWILFVISYILEKFSIAILFQFATTCIFCGRFAGVLLRKKTYFVLEILGLAITFGWRIIRKRLVWYVLIGSLIVRGIFVLIVLYHMKNYMFITREIKVNNGDD